MSLYGTLSEESSMRKREAFQSIIKKGPAPAASDILHTELSKINSTK